MERLKPGSRVGETHWTVEKEIGHGAFSIVYDVKWRDFHRAFKMIDTTGDYTTEAENMMKLENCPNVVVCYDWLSFSGKNPGGKKYSAVGIFMEECEGTLQDCIRNRCFDEKDITVIGKNICKALEACHEMEIIHGDVKPANIFIKGDVYLLGDFGISRLVSEGKEECGGTPAYAYQGGTNSKEADLYSLGLVLYQLINKNKLPFVNDETDIKEAIEKRKSGAPILRPADVSDGLWNVLQKAFRQNGLYNNAKEMLDDLDKLGTADHLEPETEGHRQTGLNSQKIKRKPRYNEQDFRGYFSVNKEEAWSRRIYFKTLSVFAGAQLLISAGVALAVLALLSGWWLPAT